MAIQKLDRLPVESVSLPFVFERYECGNTRIIDRADRFEIRYAIPPLWLIGLLLAAPAFSFPLLMVWLNDSTFARVAVGAVIAEPWP